MDTGDRLKEMVKQISGLLLVAAFVIALVNRPRPAVEAVEGVDVFCPVPVVIEDLATLAIAINPAEVALPPSPPASPVMVSFVEVSSINTITLVSVNPAEIALPISRPASPVVASAVIINPADIALPLSRPATPVNPAEIVLPVSRPATPIAAVDPAEIALPISRPATPIVLEVSVPVVEVAMSASSTPVSLVDPVSQISYLGVCDMTDSPPDREFKERYQTWKTHSQARWVVFVFLMSKTIKGPGEAETTIVLATLTVIDRSASISGSKGDGVKTGGGTAFVPWHGLWAVVEEPLPSEATRDWSNMAKSRRQAVQIQWLDEADKIPTKAIITKRRSVQYDYPGDINDLEACTADQRSRVIDRAAGMTADEAEKMWLDTWES